MFDPLHKWLGIPPDEQPPNHYRLLGITIYENDPEVIDAAADKQLAFLHDLTNGDQAEMAELLSNQVSAARLCLLDDEKKIAYDDVLRGSLAKVMPSDHGAGSYHTTAEPSYQIPVAAAQPVSPTPSSTVVRTSKHAPSRKPTRSVWSYSNLSTLLCVVALALIGIGLWQGRFKIDFSLLEDLGLISSTKPSPEPETPNPTGQRSSSVPGRSSGRQAQSESSNAGESRGSRSSTHPSGPPVDPDTGSIPPAAPRGRSIEPLAHSSSTTSVAPASQQKPAKPSDAELSEKMALVRELYEEDYRNAKTASEKVELAQRMHRDGQDTTDDMAGRFALWQVAHDIFTREGKYSLALGIVDNLHDHYLDIDIHQRKAKSLRDSARFISGSQTTRFLDALVSVVIGCEQDDQFELAKSLAAFAEAEFESRTAQPRLTKLKKLRSEIEAREVLFNEYQAALDTLEASEDDSPSNQIVGEYLCFIRGQWDQGLKYLALGSDAEIRSAAARETDAETDESDAMAVADAWYRIAKNRSGSIGQANLHRHAYQWYTRATPNAQGLELKKVEARLAELKASVPSQLEETGIAGSTSAAKILGYRVKTSTESKSDFVNRQGNKFTLGMGSRRDGRGEALAGMELKGVDKLNVVGSASQQMLDIDPFSKTGFMVDYHTPGGYSKRIFLGLGLRPGRQYSDAPPWGAARIPDQILDIGRSDSYEIDLTRWAPSTWDGQCWFTICMQNAGVNRTLFSTVSW